MNDHDALLRAIGESPEEDTPRLAYADWLEENDQPERADFVRNQIELNRVGSNAPEYTALVRKNKFYLTEYAPHWKRALPQLEDVAWGDFRRGLIEEVQAQNEAPIVKHAQAIFAVPGIHILRLRWLDNAKSLARTPELILLRALRMVASRAEASKLQTLLASEHLRRLTVLDLHGNHGDDAVAADLADGRFPDLAELWLGSNQIGDRGARALAASPLLAHLRLLDVRNNAISHPARAALLTKFGSAVKV
jgi:uncharacterized protein (TIGR02996 family)